MKNSFLKWIYLTNKDYDSLERASRHHLVIHIFILILVVCGLLPLTLNITNNIDIMTMFIIMAILCTIVLALFRLPYLSGKLNHFRK